MQTSSTRLSAARDSQSEPCTSWSLILEPHTLDLLPDHSAWGAISLHRHRDFPSSDVVPVPLVPDQAKPALHGDQRTAELFGDLLVRVTFHLADGYETKICVRELRQELLTFLGNLGRERRVGFSSCELNLAG